MQFLPKNDIELSMRRLDTLLGRRRLRFNPYKVSDRQLLEYAWQGPWGDIDDLTQMVVMTFTRLSEVKDFRGFDGIFVRIGRNEEEVWIARGRLVHPVNAHDTLRQTRSLYGKRPICNNNDLLRLLGKTVFVSRVIHGYEPDGSGRVAYRMHRLWGNLHRDAKIIREAMCEAKIEMLQRIIDNPESQHHLNCRKGFFDYETRIRRVIEIIRHYPDTPIPED